MGTNGVADDARRSAASLRGGVQPTQFCLAPSL